MSKLFLVDAYALIYKYYYAFLTRPMRNQEGINTSIIYGFTKFLKEIIRREKPDMIGVAFDPHGGCFRRDLFKEYKANRPPTPEDIRQSVPFIKQIVESMNIPIFEVPGYEADDVIGTLAMKASEKGCEVFMVTPDKDYGQLVGENRKLYRQKGDGIEIVDSAAIESKYGIKDPILVRDILAIWGDVADNIPGVPGIGEVGASKLVRTWGDVETILENADKIGGKAGKNIIENAEQLKLSKVLTSICLDVPVEYNEENLKLKRPDNAALIPIYQKLNFRSFLMELQQENPLQTAPEPVKAQEVHAVDLFGTPVESKDKARQNTTPSQELDLFSFFSSGPASQPQENGNYHEIVSLEEVKSVIDKIREQKLVSFRVFASQQRIKSSSVLGIGLAAADDAYYIPLSLLSPEDQSSILNELKTILEDSGVDKISHDIKSSILLLRELGIYLKGNLKDTMIMHYLVDSESRHALEILAEMYLGHTFVMTDFSKASVLSQKQICNGACEVVYVTLRLFRKLQEVLEEKSLTALYRDIEEPLIFVLADMEWEGVRIDTKALSEYSRKLSSQLSLIEHEIRTISGEPSLNINSSKQLGEVLFGKLKIASKPKLTKTKQYCTDEEYLQGFAQDFPIVSRVLEYREIKKLLSTYIDALPLLVNPKTGRIHTSYNQAVTATGRLSSTNPNLQNIPIRSELGQPIRAAFIAREGNKILSADYSQVELRLMAHLSQDPELLDAFRNGEDIHASTAAKIYHKSILNVTKEERRRAKTANFGIIYGISAFGLSQRLGISRKESKELIDGYFATYGGVAQYMENAINQAKQDGYVETLYGRRRYLHDINSSNANIRAFAERNAINAPIQGSAADIMKLAMIGVWREFNRENLQSRIILQVHDEIVIDLVPSEEDAVRRIIIDQMQGAVKLLIPLIAECGAGANWLDAH